MQSGEPIGPGRMRDPVCVHSGVTKDCCRSAVLGRYTSRRARETAAISLPDRARSLATDHCTNAGRPLRLSPFLFTRKFASSLVSVAGSDSPAAPVVSKTSVYGTHLGYQKRRGPMRNTVAPHTAYPPIRQASDLRRNRSRLGSGCRAQSAVTFPRVDDCRLFHSASSSSLKVAGNQMACSLR